MDNKQEWNEFLNNLLSNAIAEYENFKEYKHIKQRLEHIDEMLTTNLTVDEKVLVEKFCLSLA